MKARIAQPHLSAERRKERVLETCRNCGPGRAWWVDVLDGWADLTLAQAYVLGLELAQNRQARGERLLGYKLGCTSRAIQQQLGADQPIFAPVFETGCAVSNVRLSAARYTNLAVEGELALRLARDLHGASLSESQAHDAIGEVVPVIELHHYVLPVGVPRVAALAATGGLHAGVVLGEACAQPGGHSAWPRLLRLSIDGKLVGAAEPPWSMESPVAALRWLAGRLSDFGLHLGRGQWVLTGSPLPLYPVQAGAKILVEAPPLGSCSAEVVP